ncbi:MAG: ABC transporter substrate-binding protein [Acutalibacteraceae bacterium]
MKKIISCLMVLLMVTGLFSGCTKNVTEISSTYYIDDAQDDGTGTNDADTASGSEDGENTTSGSTNSSGQSGTTGGGSQASGGSQTSSGSAQTKKNFDFKGKTFTMAITNEPQYYTTSFNATVSAFEKTYNCKIETARLDFESYNQQVSQRMSSGKSYDICFMHGSMFPTGPIAGIYEDLTAAVKEVNSSNLDSKKTNMFKWNGKLYGVCNSASAYPYIFYYNKLLFEESGLEDPMELYNKGKWTWDKIFEMGGEVTDSKQNVYFINSMYENFTIYGVANITTENQKAKLNLRSSAVKKSLQLIQKMYSGNNAIAPKYDSSVGNSAFAEGRNYMYVQESSKYTEVVTVVSGSGAFKKDRNNLGIVPIPLPAENTEKAYPTGWLVGVCAGTGSDARVAVLWADFVATYNPKVKGKNEMTDEHKALINKLLAGNTVPGRHGAYTTGGTRTLDLHETLIKRIGGGEDISKVIDELYPQYVAAIEAVVGKGNYIAN